MNIHFFWFFWLNLSNCKDISMSQICQAKSLNQLNGKFPKVMLTLGHSLYHKQWIKNWKLKMDICYKKIKEHKNLEIWLRAIKWDYRTKIHNRQQWYSHHWEYACDSKKMVTFDGNSKILSILCSYQTWL